MPSDLVNMPLMEFCNRAKRMLGASQSDFVRFVLTGCHAGRQAYIDPIENWLTEDEELHVVRDYDSLLGIDKHICVQRYLTVYPVAKKEDMLCRNLHIQYEFHTSRACAFLCQESGVLFPDVHLCFRAHSLSTSIKFLISASQNGMSTIWFVFSFLDFIMNTQHLHFSPRKSRKYFMSRAFDLQYRIFVRITQQNGPLHTVWRWNVSCQRSQQHPFAADEDHSRMVCGGPWYEHPNAP